MKLTDERGKKIWELKKVFLQRTKRRSQEERQEGKGEATGIRRRRGGRGRYWRERGRRGDASWEEEQKEEGKIKMAIKTPPSSSRKTHNGASNPLPSPQFSVLQAAVVTRREKTSFETYDPSLPTLAEGRQGG